MLPAVLIIINYSGVSHNALIKMEDFRENEYYNSAYKIVLSLLKDANSI
jgi:hypothetical protein